MGARLYEVMVKLLKDLFPQHVLALLLIPNPRKYIGYSYLCGLWESEYFPLGSNRMEYLLNCFKAKLWPWQSDEALSRLVTNINDRNGLWAPLIGKSVSVPNQE